MICSECYNPIFDPADCIDGSCDECVDKLLQHAVPDERDSIGRFNNNGKVKATRKSAPSSVLGSKTVANKSWQL